MSTTREAAITALIAKLGTITIGNGYAVTVKKVQRSDRKQLLYENGYPAIVVLDKGDASILRKTGGLADIYTRIELVCYVRSRTTMSMDMNTLDVAIKSAIGQDATFGGAIAYASVLSDMQKDLTGDDDVASFIRPIQLFYEAQYSNGM